jgi:nucleotide-binding universal stress UspA family protein
MPLFKHILLATDGSAASEHAAARAVELARDCGARLTAVYVVDPYPYIGVGETNPVGLNAYLSAARDHAAAAHARVSALADQGGAPLQLEVLLVEDMAADKGILASAGELGADLVIVGSHGRTGLRRLLLGSVAAKVIAASPVPVLVVP